MTSDPNPIMRYRDMTTKTVLAVMLTLLVAASPLRAEDTRALVVADTVIAIPIPREYVDVSKQRQSPENYVVFGKAEPEEWEKRGEVSDNILVYGLGFKPASELVKQQKFEAIVRLFAARIAAQIDNSSTPVPEPDSLIAADLIENIYKNSYGRNAYAMEMTDDRQDRKAIFIDTAMVMPGVVTFPMIEEVSFVRVRDRIVISHASAVDTSKLQEKTAEQRDVRSRLKATGAEIRDRLLDEN